MEPGSPPPAPQAPTFTPAGILADFIMVVVFVLSMLSLLMRLLGVSVRLERDEPEYEAIPTARRRRRMPVVSMDALDSVDRLSVDRVQGSNKVYGGTSVVGLRPGHEPRRSAIRMIESPVFDPSILVAILANCVTMAWQSYAMSCLEPSTCAARLELSQLVLG
eukprot:4444896-Prymnesium_polylepis.2